MIEVLQSVIEEIQAIGKDSDISISSNEVKVIVRRIRRVQRMARRRIWSKDFSLVIAPGMHQRGFQHTPIRSNS